MDGDLRAHTEVYKTVDGCPVRLDVYPVARPSSPVLVCIHGGALIWGSRADIASGGARLLTGLCAEAGYTQVSIDYRLAPETKLSGILDDVADAWAWVQRELPGLADVDTSRVAVLGRSAGGYLALTAAYRVTPRPRAIVSLYGYGDIAASWYAEPSAHYLDNELISEEAALRVVGSETLSEAGDDTERWRFYLFCRQHGLWIQRVAGLDPRRDAGTLRHYRPICNVSPSYPPTLLVHGTDDTDVPYEQSSEMAAALHAQGVSAELVTIPGGAHAFDETVVRSDLQSGDPTPAASSFHRIVRFLDTFAP
jgi:acetyl esterase/lipase